MSEYQLFRHDHPTFIPHASALDLNSNGKSKFDTTFASADPGFHDEVPSDIIAPLLQEVTTVPPLPPPLSVDLSGPSYLNEGEFGTWTASTSGGTGSYDYDWYLRYYDYQDWTPQSTDASSLTFGIDLISEPRYMDVKVEVSSGDQTGIAQRSFIVRNNGDDEGGCNAIIAVVSNGSTTVRSIPRDSTTTIRRNQAPPAPCLSATSFQEEQASARKASAMSKAGAMSKALPDEFSLQESYPNPVRSQATIRYGLPEEAEVRVTVYDALGRQVATLAAGRQEAGWHEAPFETSRLPSGVYLVRMQAGKKGFAATKRIVVAE